MSTERDDEKYMEWVNSRPKRIKDVLYKYFVPVAKCYHLSDDPEHKGHYEFLSIVEPKDQTTPVTVTITHGRDSFMPGFRVFGIKPETLVPCNCGKWEPPTEKQMAEAHEYAEHVRASRKS